MVDLTVLLSKESLEVMKEDFDAIEDRLGELEQYITIIETGMGDEQIALNILHKVIEQRDE
jgi:hypothetical protein